MELQYFNYNKNILSKDVIILIYSYLDNFDDILKIRLVNKSNKYIIDENIFYYYKKNFKFLSKNLSKFDLINLNLDQKVSKIIFHYHNFIEKMRQKQLNNPNKFSSSYISANKGFKHFKKSWILKHNGIKDHIAEICVDEFNQNQLNICLMLKKLNVDDWGCYSLAKSLDEEKINKALFIIKKNFCWCYAVIALQEFNEFQINKMIKIRELGFSDTESFQQVKILDYMSLND
jgi:hypothetical protein